MTERRRLLIRRDPAVWPLVWRGLLPLLGLLALLVYAVWPFAREEIEANVQRSVLKAMADRGLKDVVVRVSGQHVLLTGALPAEVTTLEAIALAQRATCPTWAGPQPCAELVLAAFDGAALPGTPALPTLPSASGIALPNLPAMPSAGSAPAASAAERVACEKALAEVVARERIVFAIGSAELLPASRAALDAVAQAHAGCRGTVRVEGHTDDRGQPTTNQALSLARARAVRQALIARGVPADRLVAEGFGAERPVADNATDDGRRRNRRIEFKVVEPG